MAGTSFSLTPEVRVFPCPNCRETINTSMQQCPFCLTSIDRIAAEQSAAATSKISRACSDASYLRILCWALITFFAMLFFPFVGLAGVVGLGFLRLAIPFMTIRWWIRFGSLQTRDPDFIRAKRSAIVVSVVALLGLVSLWPQYFRR